MAIIMRACPARSLACPPNSDAGQDDSLTCAYLPTSNNQTMYVFLYKNGDILSRNKLTYLGLLGMRVKADPLLFPKYTQIDAAFYLETLKGVYQCKLNAVVTCRSGQAVGFTFANCNWNTYEKLKKLIRYMRDYRSREQVPLILNYSLIPD